MFSDREGEKRLEEMGNEEGEECSRSLFIPLNGIDSAVDSEELLLEGLVSLSFLKIIIFFMPNRCEALMLSSVALSRPRVASSINENIEFGALGEWYTEKKRVLSK
jgi:hypothetical protein